MMVVSSGTPIIVMVRVGDFMLASREKGVGRHVRPNSVVRRHRYQSARLTTEIGDDRDYPAAGMSPTPEEGVVPIVITLPSLAVGVTAEKQRILVSQHVRPNLVAREVLAAL